MRGRKPIPTTVKLQRGNPGHKPINEREAHHAPLETGVPDELIDPVARVEWARLAAPLSEAGQCTTVDRPTLIAFCLKYAQWRALEAKAYGDPDPANPAAVMANKVFSHMFKAATELGITPSARSRVAVVSREVQDEFANRQQARPMLKLAKK